MFSIKPSFAENSAIIMHMQKHFFATKKYICCTWGCIERGWGVKEARSSCLQEGYSNSFVV